MSQSSMNFRAAMIVSALAGIARQLPRACQAEMIFIPDHRHDGCRAWSGARREQVLRAVRHDGWLAGERRCVGQRIAHRKSRHAHLRVARDGSRTSHDDDHHGHDYATHETHGMGQRLAFAGAGPVALNQAGISNPTGAQLQAALQGGSVTTADGNTVTFAGVLQQRANGVGWGRIAQSYGTTMGAVNRGIKAPTINVVSTSTSPRTDVPTPRVPRSSQRTRQEPR